MPALVGVYPENSKPMEICCCSVSQLQSTETFKMMPVSDNFFFRLPLSSRSLFCPLAGWRACFQHFFSMSRVILLNLRIKCQTFIIFWMIFDPH